jgi:hypothetical protein
MEYGRLSKRLKVIDQEVGSVPAIETIVATGVPLSDNQQLIADERFIAQLDEVKKLKQFLFEQKVKFESKQLELIDLGNLNNLRFGKTGRVPTPDEWVHLDKSLSHLEAVSKLGVRHAAHRAAPWPLSDHACRSLP